MKSMLKGIGVGMATALAGAMSLTSCYEEPDTSQIFSAEEQTIAEIIQGTDSLTAFNAILTK